MKIILAAAALAVASPAAWAQEPAAPPAAAPAAAPAQACCVIPAGTPIVLELLDELSSRTAMRGDHFAMRLVEPITVDGRVLAPAGARGTGEVIDAAKAGMGGRPGELTVAARYLAVGDLQIPLRSLKLAAPPHGANNSKDAQTAVLLVGVGGMFIRGGDLVAPIGARGDAKVARDITLPAPAPAEPAAGVSQPGKSESQ